MLIGESTKKDAGIILWGDYYDLDNLYDSIFQLSESPALKGFMSDYVLGLCYEIRHASHGMREEKTFGTDKITKVKYYGVKIIWTYFITQVGLLRWAAGFTPTSNDIQANLFRLEDIIEKSLNRASPSAASECLLWLRNFRGFSPDYTGDFLNEIARMYIFDNTISKKRIDRLPILLRMTFQLSPQYKLFRENLENEAAKRGRNIHDLRSNTEWPDFTW